MKKYELDKLYIGQVGRVCKINNALSYPGWKNALIIRINNIDNKLYIKDDDSYYDVLKNSKIKEWDNVSDRLNADYGELIIPSNHKEIKFLDYLKKFDVSCNQNEITIEEAYRYLLRAYEKNIYNSTETLAIIKPDGIKNIDKIIEMFYKEGLKIKKYKIERLSEELVDEHYSHLLDKPFYPKLKEFMMSAPVAIMILEGENAVSKLRDLMGPTDSTKALPNTIRGKFGTNNMYNAIHGSDSDENALIEINRFFNQKTKIKEKN